MIEIAQFITAVSHATNVTKALFQAKSDAIRDSARLELLEAMLDLNSKALSIQTLYQSELESNVALKKQLAAYDKWEQEKTRYKLQNVGAAGKFGTFVYTLDPDQKFSESPHWICATCYQNRKKSVLQASVGKAMSGTYKCHTCGSEILVIALPP